MNILKNVLFLLLIVPFGLHAMEVDRSEYYSSDISESNEKSRFIWNSLGPQVHHEHCSSLLNNLGKNHILQNLVTEKNARVTHVLDEDRKGGTFYRDGNAFHFDSSFKLGNGKKCSRIIAKVLESASGKYVALLFGSKGSQYRIEIAKIIELASGKSKTVEVYYSNSFFVGDKYFAVKQSSAIKPNSYKHTVSYYDLNNLGDINEKPESFECTSKYKISLIPAGQNLIAWLDHGDSMETIVHLYDLSKGAEVDTFSIGCRIEPSKIAISEDGQKLILDTPTKYNTYNSIIEIALFHRYIENDKTKWRKIVDWKAPFRALGAHFSLDPLNADHLIVRNGAHEMVYDFAKVIAIDHYLFRNPTSLLRERKYSGEGCKIIDGQTESKRIRTIDLLRFSLINHIFKGYPGKALLCKRDSDLLEKGFPDLVKKILKSQVNTQPVIPVIPATALALTFPYTKTFEWFKQINPKKHCTENKEEPITKRICLSKENNEKNNDKQEEPLTDEEAEFDKFMRETQGYMDEE